jgi:hypothetical protein
VKGYRKEKRKKKKNCFVVNEIIAKKAEEITAIQHQLHITILLIQL